MTEKEGLWRGARDRGRPACRAGNAPRSSFFRQPLAWLVAFFLHAGSAAEGAGIPELVARLDDADGRVREEAMTALAALGEEAGPALLDIEKNGSSEAQWRATTLLERIPWVRPGFEERTKELVEVLKTTRDLDEGAWAFAELRKGGGKVRALLAALFPNDPVPPGSVKLSCEIEEQPGGACVTLHAALANEGEYGIWINARGFHGVVDGVPFLSLRSARSADPERARERGFRYNLLYLPPGGAHDVRIEVRLGPGQHAVSVAYDSTGGPWEPAFVQARAVTEPTADEDAFIPRAAPLAMSIALPPIRRVPPIVSTEGAAVFLEAGVPGPSEDSNREREIGIPLAVSGRDEDAEGRFVVVDAWAVFLDGQGKVAGFFPCSKPPDAILLTNERNARTWRGRVVPELAPGDYRLVVSCIGIHVTNGLIGKEGGGLMGMPEKVVIVSKPTPVELK